MQGADLILAIDVFVLDVLKGANRVTLALAVMQALLAALLLPLVGGVLFDLYDP